MKQKIEIRLLKHIRMPRLQLDGHPRKRSATVRTKRTSLRAGGTIGCKLALWFLSALVTPATVSTATHQFVRISSQHAKPQTHDTRRDTAATPNAPLQRAVGKATEEGAPAADSPRSLSNSGFIQTRQATPVMDDDVNRRRSKRRERYQTSG